MTAEAPRQLLRTTEVAKRYGLSKSYFAKKRVSGDGPPYRKVGAAVLYDPDEVADWFDQHRPQQSTSEAV